MCTLIVGRDILEPRTLWLAANRDENPARPSDPPGVLVESPRVVGGRDRTARGTWLAIRERCAVVALLNRRDRAAGASVEARGADGPGGDGGAPAPTRPDRRSRGLLALETAAVPGPSGCDGLARAAMRHALDSLGRERYAPFSLVLATLDEAWLLAHDGAAPRVLPIAAGWHVVTHADLDDPAEPRTHALLKGLSAWRPSSREDIERGLIDRLRDHGSAGTPTVCIHEGVMVTVSSTVVHLAPDHARYLHAEGRPCTNAFEDRSAWLDGVGARSERT